METSLSMLGHFADNPTDADWRRLDDLYRPLLRAWTARAGVPASGVDDVVQEVLAVVVAKIREFERRRDGSFRAWLRTILTNKVRHYFSHEKHQPIATGDSDILRRLKELESPESALSNLFGREHDEHVLKTLLARVQGDFTPKTWLAFRRQVIEEEPAVQVAESLGETINCVLLAKRRVLRRLRQEAAGLVD
jgi:RNA polymerase sigma-70 factor (ECF subfamily)